MAIPIDGVVVIILFFLICIAIFTILIWYLKYKNPASTATSSLERNQSTVRPRPTRETSSNQSASYVPFISPHPPKPPPVGFGHPPDIGLITSSNGFANIYRFRRKYPYPRDPENNRTPYPKTTSCYLPAQRAPYPLTSNMPEASLPRSMNLAKCNLRKIANSARATAYSLDHEAPYPLSTKSAMPQPSSSRIPYPPECTSRAPEAPYPLSSESVMPQPSSFITGCPPRSTSLRSSYLPEQTSRAAEAPYPLSDESTAMPSHSRTRYPPDRTFSESAYVPEHKKRQTPDSTRPIRSYRHHEAPYPIYNASSSSTNQYPPEPNTSETSVSRRIAPYPPADYSLEPPPPSYEEAVRQK